MKPRKGYASPVQHLELFIATYIESLTRLSLLSTREVQVTPVLRSQAMLSGLAPPVFPAEFVDIFASTLKASMFEDQLRFASLSLAGRYCKSISQQVAFGLLAGRVLFSGQILTFMIPH